MGLSNIEVKKQNRNSVLRYMLKAEAAPKNMIAEALGLSIPTVAQGIRELEEKGLVKEEGVLESMGAGRLRATAVYGMRSWRSDLILQQITST